MNATIVMTDGMRITGRIVCWYGPAQCGVRVESSPGREYIGVLKETWERRQWQQRT